MRVWADQSEKTIQEGAALKRQELKQHFRQKGQYENSGEI